MSCETRRESLEIYPVDGWSDKQRDCMKLAAKQVGFEISETDETGKGKMMIVHEDGIHDSEFFRIFANLLNQPPVSV